MNESIVFTLGNIQSSSSLQDARVNHSMSSNHLYHSRSAPTCQTTSSEIAINVRWNALRKRLPSQMKNHLRSLRLPDVAFVIDLTKHFTDSSKSTGSRTSYDNLITQLLYLVVSWESNEYLFSLNVCSFSSTLNPGGSTISSYFLPISSFRAQVPYVWCVTKSWHIICHQNLFQQTHFESATRHDFHSDFQTQVDTTLGWNTWQTRSFPSESMRDVSPQQQNRLRELHHDFHLHFCGTIQDS